MPTLMIAVIYPTTSASPFTVVCNRPEGGAHGGVDGGGIGVPSVEIEDLRISSATTCDRICNN